MKDLILVQGAEELNSIWFWRILIVEGDGIADNSEPRLPKTTIPTGVQQS
jgi:hypothetical protein